MFSRFKRSQRTKSQIQAKLVASGWKLQKFYDYNNGVYLYAKSGGIFRVHKWVRGTENDPIVEPWSQDFGKA